MTVLALSHMGYLRWLPTGADRRAAHVMADAQVHLELLYVYGLITLAFQRHADMQFPQLLIGHRRRRVGHEVNGFGGLREGNDFAQA